MVFMVTENGGNGSCDNGSDVANDSNDSVYDGVILALSTWYNLEPAKKSLK